VSYRTKGADVLVQEQLRKIVVLCFYYLLNSFERYLFVCLFFIWLFLFVQVLCSKLLVVVFATTTTRTQFSQLVFTLFVVIV
jgi:hypothetical protein